MLQLIDEYGNDDEYTSLREFIVHVDRLVDICNNNTDKHCFRINSPDHNHIEELLEILDFFGKWNSESLLSKRKDHFMTRECFEDVQWLIFGIVGHAKCFLKKDESRIMVQRNGGSDVCEHEFSGIRSRNNKPNHNECDEIVARRTNIRAHNLFGIRKTNCSAPIIASEVLGPLKKRARYKQIK